MRCYAACCPRIEMWFSHRSHADEIKRGTGPLETIRVPQPGKKVLFYESLIRSFVLAPHARSGLCSSSHILQIACGIPDAPEKHAPQ